MWNYNNVPTFQHRAPSSSKVSSSLFLLNPFSYFLPFFSWFIPPSSLHLLIFNVYTCPLLWLFMHHLPQPQLSSHRHTNIGWIIELWFPQKFNFNSSLWVCVSEHYLWIIQFLSCSRFPKIQKVIHKCWSKLFLNIKSFKHEVKMLYVLLKYYLGHRH